jgi:hypothetical protein
VSFWRVLHLSTRTSATASTNSLSIGFSLANEPHGSPVGRWSSLTGRRTKRAVFEISQKIAQARCILEVYQFPRRGSADLSRPICEAYHWRSTSAGEPAIEEQFCARLFARISSVFCQGRKYLVELIKCCQLFLLRLHATITRTSSRQLTFHSFPKPPR